MKTNQEKIEQVRGAWKTTLGVAGALAGVGVIVLLLAIVVKVGLVHPTVAGVMTDQQRYDLLSKARSDDHTLLTTYGWMDQSKGVVRLPIDVAMQKLLQERSAAGPAGGAR